MLENECMDIAFIIEIFVLCLLILGGARLLRSAVQFLVTRSKHPRSKHVSCLKGPVSPLSLEASPINALKFGTFHDHLDSHTSQPHSPWMTSGLTEHASPVGEMFTKGYVDAVPLSVMRDP